MMKKYFFAHEKAPAGTSSDRGNGSGLFYWDFMYSKNAAPIFYPLANAAVVGESEPFRDFRLRVPSEQKPYDSLVLIVQP